MRGPDAVASQAREAAVDDAAADTRASVGRRAASSPQRPDTAAAQDRGDAPDGHPEDAPDPVSGDVPVISTPIRAPEGRPEETDAERLRRRALFLRELAEAHELRERIQPRRTRTARLRQMMRMRTFRY
ncbi:hypothetical protein ACPA54_38080 [Uniformispora flossi]|uniref:hypothetical protein n=1 Tax=Uniformispora flossi TaxID=3390723 RepID=UPI003C2DFE11